METDGPSNLIAEFTLVPSPQKREHPKTKEQLRVSRKQWRPPISEAQTKHQNAPGFDVPRSKSEWEQLHERVYAWRVGLLQDFQAQNSTPNLDRPGTMQNKALMPNVDTCTACLPESCQKPTLPTSWREVRTLPELQLRVDLDSIASLSSDRPTSTDQIQTSQLNPSQLPSRLPNPASLSFVFASPRLVCNPPPCSHNSLLFLLSHFFPSSRPERPPPRRRQDQDACQLPDDPAPLVSRTLPLPSWPSNTADICFSVLQSPVSGHPGASLP